MARETRWEREAAERAAYEAEKAATYPQRLMEILERAQKTNFELLVRDNRFHLNDRDDRDDRIFELSLDYSKENQETLIDLDWRIEIKEEAALKAELEAVARRAALAKLSQEERRLLGL